jgi:tetratricopeptide (TPR) repeat protein
MRSMTPREVRDRLDERFRFLSGPRRSEQRHRTLHNTVQWSFDLLTDEERTLLCRSSVFAGGFDVAAARSVCADERVDELDVLEVLDSLVRKSLVSADATGAGTRFGTLETIREFALEQLAASGEADAIRRRHARHFATQADRILELWASPQQRLAYRSIEAEFPNLRAAFRWAVGHGELECAGRIAVSTSIVGVWTLRYEQFAWAEELLDSARRGGARYLPSLYAAAAHCCLIGRVDDAIAYGEEALALNDHPDYDCVPFGYGYLVLGAAYLFAGRVDKQLETASTCRGRADDRLSTGPCQLTLGLARSGRFDEAQAMAQEATAASAASGIPSQIAYSLLVYSNAFAESDPALALAAMRRGLEVAHDSANLWHESYIGAELAGLEARHGNASAALESLGRVVESQFHAGDVVMLSVTFGHLAVLLDRLGHAEAAGTIYGAVTDPKAAGMPPDLAATLIHLEGVLGSRLLAERVRIGAAMDRREATLYAQAEIERAISRQS